MLKSYMLSNTGTHCVRGFNFVWLSSHLNPEVDYARYDAFISFILSFKHLPLAPHLRGSTEARQLAYRSSKVDTSEGCTMQMLFPFNRILGSLL